MLDFNLYQLILIVILMINFIIQMFYYLKFYANTLYYKNKIKKNKVDFSTEQVPVSVIIAAKNEANNLRNFLPEILTQDYPNYEVIVVNDGSTDESDIILADFSKKHEHLYYTFLPNKAKFISTKKMALTIGVKAAKNDLLLFTDADCVPNSKNWISSIVRNFNDETDLVLSYGAYFKEKRFLSRLISYDTFFIALQYLGFALSGFPYMGVGRNLAYRKEVFFKNKGFAGHLNLLSGDDDLFISEIANKNNTRVEISKESITHSIPKESFKSWVNQKIRHLSTSPFYKKKTKLLIGLENLSRFLFYLSLVLLLFSNHLSLYIFVGSLFLIRYLTQLFVINLSSKHFNERKFYLSLILFDILLPLITFFIMIVGSHKKKNSIKWE